MNQNDSDVSFRNRIPYLPLAAERILWSHTVENAKVDEAGNLSSVDDCAMTLSHRTLSGHGYYSCGENHAIAADTTSPCSRPLNERSGHAPIPRIKGASSPSIQLFSFASSPHTLTMSTIAEKLRQVISQYGMLKLIAQASTGEDILNLGKTSREYYGAIHSSLRALCNVEAYRLKCDGSGLMLWGGHTQHVGQGGPLFQCLDSLFSGFPGQNLARDAGKPFVMLVKVLSDEE